MQTQTRDVTNAPGPTNVLDLAVQTNSNVLAGAMWVLMDDSGDLNERLWRVISVDQNSLTQFTITAVLHFPGKAAEVEDIKAVDPGIPWSI
jgi:predicted phage tail protein